MPKCLKLKIVLAFAAVYLIWGSTYLAIRWGIETMPPFVLAGIRFLAGGLAIFALTRAGGARPPTPAEWKHALIIGILMPVGGTGLVTWAETMVPSGLTALLIAMVPMWVVLADWIRPGGKRPAQVVTAGLVLGFAGVALLINPTNIGGFGEIDGFGALLIVVATMSWAAGSIYSRSAAQPRSKMLAVGMQMIAGGGVLVLVSAFTGELSAFDPAAVSLKSWLSVLYLACLGSTAFVAYMWLLTVSSPAKAVTYAYVNPIIALVLGAVLAAETLSSWTLACSAVVIVAVAMIITARSRAASAPEGAPKCAAAMTQ